MFSVSKISQALFGIVGFKNPYNPDYAIVSIENQESRSGYYVTDNSLAKIEALKDCQDYKNISDEDFNTFLSDLQKDSIATVCSSVFNRSEFIDRNFIYSNASNKNENESLPNGFVYFKIEVSKKRNLAFEISRVILDFDGSGDVELILFSSARKTPLYTKTVTISSDYQEEKLNWVVDSIEGDYYLGYKTTGLTVAPFVRNVNDSSYENSLTHLFITKGVVEGHNTNVLFDVRNEDSISQSIGLNPDITIYDDATQLIIQNENLLARAIYLDMVIKCLSVYASSFRSNRNERESKELYTRIQMEINGDNRDGHLRIDGLEPKFSREIKKLKTEIAKLNAGYYGHGLMVDTVL